MKLLVGLILFEGYEGKLLGGHFLCVFLHCLTSMYFPVSKFHLFIGHQSYWIRVHPNDVTLT